MILSIVAFVLVLSVLVFVHELGHFAVAKWSGMRVDEFIVGFPPRAFSRKKGDTTYSIGWVPLGGFVRIHGEAGEEDSDPRSFNNTPVLKRIATLAAGVVMNLLFALVALTIAFSVGFVSSVQDLTAIPGATVISSQVVLAGGTGDSPALKAGLKPGDLILGLTDATGTKTVIRTISELQAYTASHQALGQRDITVSYDRAGSAGVIPVTLAESGPALGIYIDTYNTVRVPVAKAPGTALAEIGGIASQTWGALKDFGSKLFTKGQLDNTVSGPVGIYTATSQASHEGFAQLLYLTVVLSVNLALLNVLPIPPLDGGKLAFLFIELVFRKRVIRQEIEGGIAMLGMVLVGGLVLVVTVRDIMHLF